MRSETLIGSFAIGAALVLGILLGVVNKANAWHERGLPVVFVGCESEEAILKAFEILKTRAVVATDFPGPTNRCQGVPGAVVTPEVNEQLTQMADWQKDFSGDVYAPFEMDIGEQGSFYVLVWLPVNEVPGQDS